MIGVNVFGVDSPGLDLSDLKTFVEFDAAEVSVSKTDLNIVLSIDRGLIKNIQSKFDKFKQDVLLNKIHTKSLEFQDFNEISVLGSRESSRTLQALPYKENKLGKTGTLYGRDD